MAAKEVIGFNPQDAEALIALIGTRPTNAPRNNVDIGQVPHLFIARSPSGGIPAATGSWPAITVSGVECDVGWIDANTLKPLLNGAGEAIKLKVFNLASAAVDGSKILVCAREFHGFENVVIWELC
jgi:hypothetical protein